MCAPGLLAGEYQTVRITNVDKALAKYTATTNGMAKNKIQFVKHNLVWPDGETAALCVPKTGVRNQRLELPVEIKRAGRYSFWIRHWRSENMHTALEFLLRSPSTECVNYTLVDRIADMWTDKDAPERKFRSGKPAGWIWTKVEVGIEHPGRYVVNLARNTRYVQRGMNIGSNVFVVAECWVTDDPNADPSKAPLVESDVDPVNAVPPGFVAASSHKPHVMLNSSIEDSTKRPPNQFMECYSWFMDPVRYLKYGATDGLWCGAYEAENGYKITDLNAYESGSIFYGASFRGNADSSQSNEKILAKKYPFSTCCIVLIWILSFLPFPEMKGLDDVPFVDKWTHIVMYGGTCCVIWTEYVRQHLTLDGEKLFIYVWLLPILMSGVIELLQEYCTTYRGGEWLDMAANSTGVTLAVVYGLLFRYFYKK